MAKLAPTSTLSKRAAADLAFLGARLGSRCHGLFREEDGSSWFVELVALVKQPGLGRGGRAVELPKRRWYYGKTPEAALSLARTAVEEAITRARVQGTAP